MKSKNNRYLHYKYENYMSNLVLEIISFMSLMNDHRWVDRFRMRIPIEYQLMFCPTIATKVF